MKSLKSQLILAFLVTIVSELLLIAFLTYGHFSVVNLYKDQIDKMVLEYSLLDQTSQVISSYNSLTKYVNDPDKKQAYLDSVTEVNKTAQILENQITDKESLIAFAGLRNSIDKVIEHTNQGYQVIENNDITESSTHFDEANRQYEFVRENITELILKELNFAQVTQTVINRTRTTDLIITSVIITSVLTLMLFFAWKFAQVMTRPITQLTNLAKEIAEGDLKTVVATNLKQRTDELGSLARSFDTMVENLRKNFNQLHQTNQQLTQTKNEFEEVNKRLTKMNQFMVNREIRMRELKQELAATKTK